MRFSHAAAVVILSLALVGMSGSGAHAAQVEPDHIVPEALVGMQRHAESFILNNYWTVTSVDAFLAKDHVSWADTFGFAPVKQIHRACWFFAFLTQLQYKAKFDWPLFVGSELQRLPLMLSGNYAYHCWTEWYHSQGCDQCVAEKRLLPNNAGKTDAQLKYDCSFECSEGDCEGGVKRC